MQAPLTFILAFVAVLALIAALAWGLRRFAGNRLGANTNRSRMPRLAVIDAAAVDGRRRLVLVRRDNIEHLLMIGGPTDIVVEPNIVRAMPARDQMAPRPVVGGGELPPRIAPLPDAGNWNDGDGARADAFDHAEPQLPEPPRPARPSFVDEVRRTAPPLPERSPERAAERRNDPLLAGFTPEPLSPRAESRPEPRADMRNEPVAPRLPRTEPIMPRPARPIDPPKPPPLRAERPAAPPPPPPIPPAPAAPAPGGSLSAADQNLAEMAQRLEAALRRPVEPSEPRTGAPPVAPEPPPSRPAPRVEPPAPPPAAATPAKSGFENLEDEMASLLGRPKSPS
jgi:flagellar protein FliO/FliZ